jgi:7-cyano-7-deazaguanine synthase
LFLLHSCSIAKFYNASTIYIAAVADDQHAYPDCRPKFFEAFQSMIDSQEEDKVKILYPFVNKNKTDIVKLGEKLKVPWKDTWTCYKGLENPCKSCDACIERSFAFSSLNMQDPLLSN